MKNSQIAIIGGSGHVGMPLALKFASKGFIRSNYEEKLVDLSDVRLNLKSKN